MSDPGGAAPKGGRVRGVSARRALETARGDGTSPANWFSPALAGADFWGPGRTAPFIPLGGLDAREALCADQTGPQGLRRQLVLGP